MRRLALLHFIILAGCTAKTPAIHMRFVDDVNKSPIAEARASFCATAWSGTVTGHGGSSVILFDIEAVTDANGVLIVPPREYEARPFGMNTNFNHSQLLIVKPGYESKKIVNWGAALGDYAAVSDWAYNDVTIGLKREPAGGTAQPQWGNQFVRQCGDGLLPPQAPRSTATPVPVSPARPVRAPPDPGGQHRSAAQPAR